MDTNMNGHLDVAETWIGTWDGNNIDGPPEAVTQYLNGLVRPFLGHIRRGNQIVVTFHIEAVNSGQ